jgi:hypothetical protein
LGLIRDTFVTTSSQLLDLWGSVVVVFIAVLLVVLPKASDFLYEGKQVLGVEGCRAKKNYLLSYQ